MKYNIKYKKNGEIIQIKGLSWEGVIKFIQEVEKEKAKDDEALLVNRQEEEER